MICSKFIFLDLFKMDIDTAKWIEEAIGKLDSRDPVFWVKEFGEEYGLVEPERNEWINVKEYEDFKLE